MCFSPIRRLLILIAMLPYPRSRDRPNLPPPPRTDGAGAGGRSCEARPETTLGSVARVNDAEAAVRPGAAHAILFDRPDESIALLRAWLRRQDDIAND